MAGMGNIEMALSSQDRRLVKDLVRALGRVGDLEQVLRRIVQVQEDLLRLDLMEAQAELGAPVRLVEKEDPEV